MLIAQAVHDHEHHDHEHHDHDHDHDHHHDHDHMAPAERPPAGGPVVFDIGNGIGALIVKLDDSLAGTEIPIESIDDPTMNVHTGIWRRANGDVEQTLAIFPELKQGRYRFAATSDHPAGEVVVVSGAVAHLDLRTTG